MQTIRFLGVSLGVLATSFLAGCDVEKKQNDPEYSQKVMRQQLSKEYLASNDDSDAGKEQPAAATQSGANEKPTEEQAVTPAKEDALTIPHIVAKEPIEYDSEEKLESSAEWVIEPRYKGLLAGLTIFVLAIFVGFEVITKVPPTLHTPLMSGSNAISGITLVGAVTVTGMSATFSLSVFTGFIAIILATINVVGGFFVTHRMLSMFKKR